MSLLKALPSQGKVERRAVCSIFFSSNQLGKKPSCFESLGTSTSSHLQREGPGFREDAEPRRCTNQGLGKALHILASTRKQLEKSYLGSTHVPLRSHITSLTKLVWNEYHTNILGLIGHTGVPHLAWLLNRWTTALSNQNGYEMHSEHFYMNSEPFLEKCSSHWDTALELNRCLRLYTSPQGLTAWGRQTVLWHFWVESARGAQRKGTSLTLREGFLETVILELNAMLHTLEDFVKQKNKKDYKTKNCLYIFQKFACCYSLIKMIITIIAITKPRPDLAWDYFLPSRSPLPLALQHTVLFTYLQFPSTRNAKRFDMLLHCPEATFGVKLCWNSSELTKPSPHPQPHQSHNLPRQSRQLHPRALTARSRCPAEAVNNRRTATFF